MTMGRRVCLLVAGMLVMQLAWLITVPPFRGSDEVDHAYRAAAVAGGEWVAGDYAEEGRGWLVTVPTPLVEAARAQCEELGSSGPDNCVGVESPLDDHVLVASSAGNYHPVYYWVVGMAGLPFRSTDALYAMRAASALLCLVFLGLAAWASLRRTSRWPAAGLVLAASPVLVYSTIVVAPNGLELAASLSLWTSLMSLPGAEDRRSQSTLMWIAIASAVVMGTLRLIGPLFVLLVLATVVVLHGRDLIDVLRQRRLTVLVGAVLVGLSVTQFAWWTFGLELDPTTGGPDGSSNFDLGHLVLWPLQSIAAFPYRDQAGPLVVYVVTGALVLTLLVLALRRGRPRERRVLTLAVLGALALPVVLTLATMDGRGVIWQGRYGLPYAVGFVLLAAHILGRHGPSPRLPWLLVGPTAVAMAVAVCASLVKVRAQELSGNAASRLDQAWHVPPVTVLVLVSLLAALCLAGAVGGATREPG
jgi:hypothetical protein